MNSKKTLVLGASNNSQRYSYLAARQLKESGHEIVLVGNKEGVVANTTIQNAEEIIEEIDTITLYLNPSRQKDYYDYIIKTNPKRVIFNPGTWNNELVALLKANKIEQVEACTLVMLSVGNY